MVAALTIAGSDSSGGAGIQADLKTFAAFGVFGATALTAVTAQNTRGVLGVHALSPSLVVAQIDAVLADTGADAVKTGMLATRAIVEAVAAALAPHRSTPIVVDPVMVATSGAALLDTDAREALVARLLPLARVVTPNVPEAEALAGMRVATRDEQAEAARRILALGPAAVVVKGGHLPGGDHVEDVLADGAGVRGFRAPRAGAGPVHGTGCTFAAALAALLALGRTLDQAVAEAQAYVGGAIRHGFDAAGSRVLDHAWQRADRYN